MRTQNKLPKRFEFYFRDLDNHVLVETFADGVVIRATRDSFSERRKTFFIRELAAEGYIPDAYQTYIGSQPTQSLRAEWLVDGAWKGPRRTPATRFMVRLLAYATLLWLGFMSVLFLCAG
jgi:hypothetical protein